MTCITSNLWIGSIESVYDSAVLEQVTHILNVAEEMHLLNKSQTHEYTKISIKDDDKHSDIRTILPDCIVWMHEVIASEKGKVLVSCLAGESRCICVAIAYLCMKCGMSFDQAYKLVCDKCSNICIYPRYLSQVQQFLKNNKNA
jgi:protein-tyrosine phosphatase